MRIVSLSSLPLEQQQGLLKIYGKISGCEIHITDLLNEVQGIKVWDPSKHSADRQMENAYMVGCTFYKNGKFSSSAKSLI